MSGQFVSDVTKPFRSITVSRKRALQLIGGAIAVAVPSRLPPSAEAAKRRKPPLVFVAATVPNVVPFGPTFPEFSWELRPALIYPAEDFRLSNSPQFADLPQNLPADKVRAGIVEFLKNWAVQVLDENATPVPRDRIAVTLI